MTENEISKIVVNICYNINKNVGVGLFESVYEKIICYELDKRNIKYICQSAIDIKYKDIRIKDAFRADLIIENKVILELKSVEEIKNVHKKQLLTYLKLTGLKLGLLINFNVAIIKEGIIRIVNNL